MTKSDLKIKAEEYLKLKFSPEEQFDLRLISSYHEHPLSGSGNYVIFQFVSSLGSDKPESYFVLTGTRGITNYYPDWGLSLTDLIAVHFAKQFLQTTKICQLLILSLI